MTKQMTKLEEMHKISEIANRAMELLLDHDPIWHREKICWVMDIEYVHESIGLKLDELLKADNSNFLHDITGIASHFNRTTKELEDCFHPRYAVNQ